jgi:ubiquinone/menaquinone biosynthesis C-methylase UbiE
MSSPDYVHGYSERETERLFDQADVLAQLLHSDTRYPPGSRVLEAGCGAGSQTRLLAALSPEARIVSLDLSLDSVDCARRATRQRGLENVAFVVGDVLALPCLDATFDHVFVCFVLEHLKIGRASCRERVSNEV